MLTRQLTLTMRSAVVGSVALHAARINRLGVPIATSCSQYSR